MTGDNAADGGEGRTLVLAGVVLVGIMLSRRGSNGPETDTQPSVAEPTPPALAETNRSSFFTKRTRRQPSQPLTNEGLRGASSAATNLVAGWEDKVDEILGYVSAGM